MRLTRHSIPTDHSITKCRIEILLNQKFNVCQMIRSIPVIFDLATNSTIRILRRSNVFFIPVNKNPESSDLLNKGLLILTQYNIFLYCYDQWPLLLVRMNGSNGLSLI